MRIVIPGGTGQVGTVLARAFHRDGHEVVALARSVKAAPWRVVQWDPAAPKGWAPGRSVNCRYTPKNREEIFRSRVDSVTVTRRRSPAESYCAPRLGGRRGFPDRRGYSLFRC